MRFVIEKLVRAERQRVFDTVANFENLDKVIPKYFPSIRVRSVRENVAIVEMHMVLANKEHIMTTKHVTKYPETHDVYVLGGNAKGSHFAEVYKKTDQGTLITVTVNYKEKILSRLFRKSNIVSEYSKMMDEFAKLVEV